MSANVRWNGEPSECRCTRVFAATLAEALDCPAAWMGVPGRGWFHVLPARRQAVIR